MLDKYPTEWQNTPTQTWRCRGPGGSHRLQNGWGVARRGPWWVRLPYASANERMQLSCAVRRNFRKAQKSAIILENILKEIENVRANSRKNCATHSAVTDLLNQLCAAPRCCHF